MKKNFSFFISACLLSGGLAFSQNSKIDSLKKILETAREDTNKIKVSNNLISAYTASGYFNLALHFSVENKALAEKLNYQKGLANCLGNMGTINWSLGNYPDAVKNHLAALKIRNAIGDKLGQIKSNFNLGLVYYYEHDFKTALKYQDEALKISKEIGYARGIGDAYISNANVFAEMKQYREALNNYELAKNIYERIGDKNRLAIYYLNTGDIYTNIAKYDSAINNYRTALSIYNETKDKLGIVFTYLNIGKHYFAKKDYSNAANYLEQALQYSKAFGFKEQIKNTYKSLSDLDSARNHFNSAFAEYKIYIAYRDSLKNEEATKKQTRTEIQYEFDKKQAADSVKVAEEKRVVAAELKREQNQRYSLYGGLVLVLVFAGTMYNRFRVTQKQKAVIEEQKIVVEEQKKIVEEKNKDILDSIHYAKRIQRALLPTETYISKKINR